MQNLLSGQGLQQFGRFFVAGAMGFAIDASLLYFLDYLGFGPYWSRTVSFPTALAATWLANRHWTFASKRSDNKAKEFSKYAAVVLTGAALNFAIYTLMLVSFDPLRDYLIVPLAFGSAGGLAVNYFGSAILVFSERTRTPAPAEIDGGT